MGPREWRWGSATGKQESGLDPMGHAHTWLPSGASYTWVVPSPQHCLALPPHILWFLVNWVDRRIGGFLKRPRELGRPRPMRRPGTLATPVSVVTKTGYYSLPCESGLVADIPPLAFNLGVKHSSSLAWCFFLPQHFYSFCSI